MKAVILLTVFYAACSTGRAQEYYTRYQRFTQKDGYSILEQPGAITQDSSGLLWIGGDNGLLCFDGAHFQNFRHRPGDSASLPANQVAFNYQDRTGRYWTYLPGHGLYNLLLPAKTFQRFSYANQNAFDINTHRIAGPPLQTRDGRLWFALPQYGLAVWNAKTGRLTPYRLCSGMACFDYNSQSWISTLAEDPDNETIWLGTNNGLLHFWPATGRIEVFKDRPDRTGETYNHLLFDENKTLWAGTWSFGLKAFDRHTQKFSTYRWYHGESGTRNICTGLAPFDSNNLWVATADGGLLLFNTRLRRFRVVQDYSGNAAGTNLSAFFANREGTVWVASDAALTRICPAENYFVYHAFNRLLNERSAEHGVYSFFKNADTLYAGIYYDGPLLALNTTTGQYRTVYPAQVRGVRCLAKDKNGTLWIGTRNGIFLYLPAQNKLSRFRGSNNGNDLSTLRVNDLLWDGEGNLWIAAHQGLLHYNPAKNKTAWILRHGSFSTQPDQWPLTLYADASGNIWFGTNGAGVGCYRRQTQRLHFFNQSRNQSYPMDQCTSITGTADGRLFFATASNGLAELQHPFTAREKLVLHNTATGFGSDKVHAVFNDPQGNFWAFTNAGICLFNPATFASRYFDGDDGLFQNNVYSHPYLDAAGNVYAGFANGFQTFKAATLLRPPQSGGRIYLSSLKIAGQPVPDGVTSLQLPYNQTDLAFDFVFLTRTQSPDYNYAYMLAGVDHHWVHTGHTPSGQYSHLPPGRYQLHLKALSTGGLWSSPELLLSIAISPPWYNSLWFYALVSLLAIGLVVGIYRYRIAQLRRQNALQQAFTKKLNESEMRALRAQMNPHFLFNCLNSINRYIVKSDPQTAAGYLTKFARLMRLILDNSATDTIPLDREIQTLQLYLEMERLRFEEAFLYTIDVEEGLHPADTLIPSMLLQPFVENAIWHGLLPKENGAGQLTLRFSQPAPDQLFIQIEDNGIGRKKAAAMQATGAARKKSYGMQMGRERIQLMNELYNMQASVSIEDLEAAGQPLGTRVVLHIPLKPATGDRTNF